MLALGTLTAAEAVAQRGGHGGGRAAAMGSRGGGANRAMSTRGSPSRDMQIRNGSHSTINHGGGRTRDFNRNPSIDRNRHNIDRNHNVNINRDVNIKRDIDIDIDHNYDWGDHYHPVARGLAAAVVTSAVIGSYYRSLPANCVSVNRGSVIYYQCGSTWYQPSYYGSSVQYVVVNTP